MAAPKILCDTAGMSEKDWLAARMHGPLGDIPYTVGGSDVAAIFGLSPWMMPLELWKIKKGQMEAPEKDNSGQLEMGHLLEPIDAKLVLVDEVSMLDVYLANKLLDAVMLGSRLVLIGDADQLPSVGPGAVLSEMIASGCVPVVRLDKVFRQEAGSRIAANAKLIRDGYKTLEWGEDFTFVESPSIEESAEKIVRLYLQEVDKYGLDNVALLTPYRKKTETGVDALNARLRDLANPPSPRKPEAHHGRKSFRVGDKVMQVKNAREVNNGDVGYIFNISYGDDVVIQVDFSGRTVDYSTDELALLDWAYASTVHKAQGSEYESVIVNLQKAHYIMLKRPLVYTAITRGKSKITLVGERRALMTAIGRTETEKRGTCLAQRIQERR